MRLEDLNWMDVERHLETEDRLMLVLGATEQHGYLSLLTDIKIPLALADSASQATGVLVAPPLNFGASPYFLAYPGTFSLRISTLMAAVEDLVGSAARAGFRRILVLNGHGGNAPRGYLAELADSLLSPLQWYDWWLSHSIEAVARKRDLRPITPTGWKPFHSQSSAPICLPSRAAQAPGSLTQRPPAGLRRRLVRGPYRVDEQIMHELFAAAWKIL
jgi:creatinine amidohydrolase